MGVEVQLLLFLTSVLEMSDLIQVPAALPSGKQPSVFIEWKVGWVSEPFRTFWRTDESPALVGNGTTAPDVQTVSWSLR